MTRARSASATLPANSSHPLLRPLLLAGVVSASLALSGCTNPYSPGQRAIGGGLLGAGGGAVIGAIAGGGNGAAIGALAGGALGAAGGAATTPNPPPRARPRGYYGY